jgi:site-specific recombinase XerD
MSNSIEKYLQQKGLAKTTITTYNTQILYFISWCDRQNFESHNASSADITSYLHYLQQKGQSNKTRNINLNAIKHYFNYLLSIDQRADNPTSQIKLRGTKQKKLYPIFTKQELEGLYNNYVLLSDDSADRHKNWFPLAQLSRQRNKVMLSLIINQGLSTDEVNRLSIKDVKLKEGKLFISGTRKSEERELELKSHQIMVLMEYQYTTRATLLSLKADALNTEQYIIPTPSLGQKAISNNTAIHIWKRLSQELKSSNKKFINFLQVRASVITHWLQHHNLREVQYRAGHRYVSTTESYLNNNIEDLQKDVESYHPIH